jgi:acyl-CoA synthetase (AMP-forming)/AMP-acid ligase II
MKREGKGSKKAEQPKATSSQRKKAAKHLDISPPYAAGEREEVIEISREHFVMQKRPITRGRRVVGKILQSIAYICLFLGYVAVIAVVVVAILKYWPQSSTAPTTGGDVTTSSGGFGGTNWWWAAAQMAMPQFIQIIQFVAVIAVAVMVIWGWRTAVRTARRFTLWIANELLKPLKYVEPITLLILYTASILGSWWLAESELFVSLAVLSLIILAVGLACFGLMRKLTGEWLDLTRTTRPKK